MEIQKLNVVGIMHIGGKIDFNFFFFERLKSIVDKTIVLLDNIDMEIDADYIIKVKKDESILWNDNVNRLTTQIAATNLGADWILSVDTDEDIDHRIKNKEDLKEIIINAEQQGFNIIAFHLREMWEDHNKYRSDGIWGRKVRVRLRKNFLKNDKVLIKGNLNKRLHSGVVLHNVENRMMHPEYEIYHYGCFNEEMRQKRVEKYRVNDPLNEFQKIGYEYIVNYEGLEVKDVIGK